MEWLTAPISHPAPGPIHEQARELSNIRYVGSIPTQTCRFGLPGYNGLRGSIGYYSG